MKLSEGTTGNVGQMWQYLMNQMEASVRTPVWIGGGQKVQAKSMLHTCNVPRYHPVIWRRIQHIFGVTSEVPKHVRTKIVYLERPHSRRVINNKELVDSVRNFIADKNQKVQLFPLSSFPPPPKTIFKFPHQPNYSGRNRIRAGYLR